MRIASLQPSISLILAALGREDSLCALTRYCIEAMPGLERLGLPVLHDSWSAATAEIHATNPDLVIASVPYRMESLAAMLKSGLPLLTLTPHSLADVFSDIRLLAALTDARSACETLIANMQYEIDTTRSGTAHARRPTAYCEEWGKPLIHSQRWVAELVEASGAIFVGTPGAHTTAEDIAAADPDVLLFAWCGAGDRVPLARVIEQRGWQRLRAVRNRRIFCVPDQWLNTPAHTLLQGLHCLRAALHPELYEKPADLIQLAADATILASATPPPDAFDQTEL